MDEAGRTRVQERFADGSLPIVCATNAFGMGIDRPDVEAVVHFEIPGSLEAYYQEIGRGGRDGRRADCTLLWNYVDVRTREFLIEQSDESASTEARRALDRKKLERMVAYADSSGCYRATILGYFGERDAPRACGGCGNCERRRALSGEELLRLRKILSGVARGGQRWGRRRIAAMLTGKLEGLAGVADGAFRPRAFSPAKARRRSATGSTPRSAPASSPRPTTRTAHSP